jgi:predicted ATPase
MLLEQILTRTDGVPLFVEELTKSILESGELKEAGDRYEYAGSARAVTIPATLRDSLMARLDRFAGEGDRPDRGSDWPRVQLRADRRGCADA